MRGDENTIQINSFAGGMDTDTSDGVIKNSSYRLANNLRYITNVGENSGELHMIEGSNYIGSLPDGYIVLAVTQLRDLAILVTETEDKTAWQVWTQERFDYSTLKLIVNVNKDDNNRVIDAKLSLVTNFEDSDNQKLYIADGRGPILYVNLQNGEIVDGQDFSEIIESTTVGSVSNISSYPAVLLNQPKFSGLTTPGQLKAGVYQIGRAHV